MKRSGPIKRSQIKRIPPKPHVERIQLSIPRPCEMKKETIPVKVFAGGREVCNLTCKDGRDEYERRKDAMFQRQGGICCLHGFIEGCPGKLKRSEAVYEHETGRGHGSGHRDDRIEVNGKRQNGVAHPICNLSKASRRINYNAVP